MELAVENSSKFEDLYDLELFLLDIAERDPDHPYHPMVIGNGTTMVVYIQVED
jgi:hypothetical protein